MTEAKYRVAVQPFTGINYDTPFHVTVTANDLAQAERRALRRAAARAKEWNAANPLAMVARRETEAAYRAVTAIRLEAGVLPELDQDGVAVMVVKLVGRPV